MSSCVSWLILASMATVSGLVPGDMRTVPARAMLPSPRADGAGILQVRLRGAGSMGTATGEEAPLGAAAACEVPDARSNAKHGAKGRGLAVEDSVDLPPVDLSGEDLSGDGGVRKFMRVHGHLSPVLSKGDEISIAVLGRVQSTGEVFMNKTRSNPFVFRYGKSEAVAGLEMGIESMKQGERAKLVVRAEYAYGDEPPYKGMPPGATLEYDVTVMCWGERDLSEGKGKVMLKVIEKEHTWEQPGKRDEVLVSLTGERTCDGQELANSNGPVWVDLGNGMLPRGLALAISEMRMGMKAQVVLTGSWAFSQRQLLTASEEMLDEDDKRAEPTPFFHPNTTIWKTARSEEQMQFGVREMAKGDVLRYIVKLHDFNVVSHDAAPDEGVIVKSMHEGTQDFFHSDIEDGAEVCAWVKSYLRPPTKTRVLQEGAYRFECALTWCLWVVLNEEMFGWIPADGFREADEMFLERTAFNISIGDAQVPRGLDLALQKVHCGQEGRIRIAPRYTRNTLNRTSALITFPEGVDVELSVNITSVRHRKQRDEKDLLDSGMSRKEQGNILFGSGDFVGASAKYEQGLKLVKSVGSQFEAQALDLKKLLHLNLAACHVRRMMYEDALASADAALCIEPHNAKGHLRRGEAHLGTGDLDRSLKDFEHVVELDTFPDGTQGVLAKLASAAMLKVRAATRARDRVDRKVYAKMFGTRP